MQGSGQEHSSAGAGFPEHLLNWTLLECTTSLLVHGHWGTKRPFYLFPERATEDTPRPTFKAASNADPGHVGHHLPHVRSGLGHERFCLSGLKNRLCLGIRNQGEDTESEC